MTASVVIPPAAALILGGLILPLLPAGLRRLAVLVLPLIALTLVFQRRIVSGLTAGAVQG